MRKLLGLVAVLALTAGLTSCTPPSKVVNLIQTVDPSRSAFHLHDSAGNTMDTLKVVMDPTVSGRYLGVYHTYNGSTYLSSVATSFDLKTWTFRRTFELAASQPYLAFGPNSVPVVADEAFHDSHIRVMYWPSVNALLTTNPTTVKDIGRTLSSCAEGTPAIRSISGVPSGNIVISHHYFQNCSTDREALGILQNFSTWGTSTRDDVDSDLTAAGAPGKHGDRDQFNVDSTDYELYEASINSDPSTFDFSKWRNYIYDGDTATQVTPQTPGHSTAFANPSTTVLFDPNGVVSLLVTEFIPTSGAATGESGELLYWNPIN